MNKCIYKVRFALTRTVIVHKHELYKQQKVQEKNDGKQIMK